MNVEWAMDMASPTDATRILQDEVIRLREQRKVLYNAFPDEAAVPLAIWQEIYEQEKKEMNVEWALSSVKKAGQKATIEARMLAKEVKRLREFDNERASIIREKNEEIKRLRDEVEVKEAEYQKVITTKAKLWGEMCNVLVTFKNI